MNKKIILTIILTLIFVIGVNETIKANTRSTAIKDLNAAWSALNKDSDKVAALVATRTTLAQNKSWFGFLNSFADEDEPPLLEEDGGGNSCLNRGGSAACYGRPEPNVETTWVWQNPTTGEWRPGGGQ